MKFNVLSDTHIELSGSLPLITPTANNLILAGDIGDPKEKQYDTFLEYLSKLYENIFLVKGNHECYGKTLEETDLLISSIVEKYENIHYLNNTFFEIEKFLIVGTTLWSNIDPFDASDISVSISDFTMIKGWSVDLHNWHHHLDLKFVREMIKKAKEEDLKLIVITHHSPLLKSVSDELSGSELNSAFQTDLSSLMDESIKLWVYGHTHCSKQRVINDVMVVSNQYGYDDEKSDYINNFCCEVL